MYNELAELSDPQLVRIWTPETNLQLERRLWIEVMSAQRRLDVGVIERDEVERSELVWSMGQHDARRLQQSLERAHEIELVTKHDLMARLRTFNEETGHEHHHLGMTSADVVENAYLIRMRNSIVRLHALHPYQTEDLPILLERMPFRGIKGPVGTQQDQVALLGSTEAAAELDHWVAAVFGFDSVVDSVGQVMHRSVDFDFLSTLAVFARRHGDPAFAAMVAGYAQMAAEYSAQTWNEGDVWQSVVRRVAIPNGVFACHLALKGRADG